MFIVILYLIYFLSRDFFVVVFKKHSFHWAKYKHKQKSDIIFLYWYFFWYYLIEKLTERSLKLAIALYINSPILNYLNLFLYFLKISFYREYKNIIAIKIKFLSFLKIYYNSFKLYIMNFIQQQNKNFSCTINIKKFKFNAFPKV